ncbi:MAG: hypothetical protein M1837_001212 [Sclerophora amabilis]|nr:MAG: hypothetical protein M1837_001212 [Sclerophora amabilis]
MAEQSVHDVVNKVQSVGDASPSDDTATKIINSQTTGDVNGELNEVSRNAEDKLYPSDSHTYITATVEPHINGVANNETATTQLAISANGPSSYGSSALGFSGEPAERQDLEEYSRNPTSGEGSDNEAGKLELIDPTLNGGSDSKGHIRSNSMKKPASFKAVSVTKNFLAKAAAGTTPSSKTSGEKAPAPSVSPSGTPMQPLLRPRLVAKSGTGLRDAAPRKASVSTAAGRGAGPDASQVWNKNRPVQPPPPKQFTDEELKQQYGIHLATRLQADEAGKEAKWADIDDDDDDWAPETIEWNDGTKITLPHHEEQAIISQKLDPLRQGAEIIARAEKGTELQQPESPISQESVPAESMKPPMLGSQLNGQKSGGLVLKGAPEKPTLVAKPPAPNPVKSPWAPLPPVERVSPVPNNQQQQNQSQQPQTSSRFQQKDAHGFESMPPAPSPAKEIAADDFNRSWRDSHAGVNRELYNSHSGRYEPVNDNRRGSMRGEQHVRQPSVLQRPLSNEHNRSAEPSAAFQTSRSTGQDGAWGRRRTSSNLSGGSGNFARRMSVTKAQEMPPPTDLRLRSRRDSQHGGPAPEGPTSPQNDSTPHRENQPQQLNQGRSSSQVRQSGHPQTLQGRPSPHLRQARPGSPFAAGKDQKPSAEPQGPIRVQSEDLPQSDSQPAPHDNPIEIQKKIMRESREQAMKRRRELEEKEEAEKKERIRLKMEALGMPPLDEKNEKEHEKQQLEEEVKPSHTEASDDTSKPDSRSQGTKSIQPVAKSSATLISDEVRHYGVMKVHQPESINKPSYSAQRTPSQGAPRPLRLSSPSKGARNDTRNNSKKADEAMPETLPGDPQQKEASKLEPGKVSQNEPQKTPWKNVPAGADTYTSWGSGGMTTHSTASGNLWGPPSNDKALGNGTFDRGFGGLAPRQIAQVPIENGPAGPAPIGPPSPSNLPKKAQNTSPPSTRTIENPPTNAFPGSVGPQPRSRSTTQANHSLLGDAIRQQGPIAPQPQPVGTADQQRASALSAWKGLSTQLERSDAEERERAAIQRAARLEKEATTGIKAEAHQPAFKETWRQVVVNGDGTGPRQVVGVTKTTAGKDVSNNNHQNVLSDQVSAGPLAPGANLSFHQPASNARGSRFFPQISDSIQQQSRRIASHSAELDGFATSPPPDSVDHPAYYGDVNHPHVSLPAPKPVVKLPPALAEPRTPPSFEPPLRPDASPPKSRSESMAGSWQDRINGLLNIAPKPFTLSGSSATRAPLDLLPSPIPATVSLPTHDDSSPLPGTAVDRFFKEESGETISKTTEESLFEEREFGSLPPVRIPKYEVKHPWQSVGVSPSQKARSRYQKPVVVASRESYSFRGKETNQGLVIEVRLPGNQSAKSFVQPRSVGSPSARPASAQPPFWKEKRRPAKAREGSATFSPSRTPLSNTPRPAALAGGSWARRVSGAV